MSTGSNIGAFDLRGRRRAELSAGGGGSSPPVVKLWEVALNAGAKHLWMADPADSLADVVGGVDMVPASGQYLLPSTLLPAADAYLPSNLRSVAGPMTPVTIELHRLANCSWSWLFQPSSRDTWGDDVLLCLGGYLDTDGLVVIREVGGTLNASTNGWSILGSLMTRAEILDRWVLMTGAWDAATQQHQLRWSIDGAPEQLVTLADASTRTSGTCAVQLGYNTSYSSQILHAHLALYDGHAALEARLALHDALGWEAP